ncbi:MFS transporter [Streptomyces sp. LP11]|uniref:MFS transporter n=2 Tax=Streptomyces pyxinicus TaxID=2970331 RepID=A0ABT2BA78_9ACTN|nr:MFS transporter [Streptomyces sp. LP11]
MSGPALLLAGFALAGSAAQASSLLAGITAAAAAGGPVLGALLDRAEHPGRLLAAALALYAGGLAAILGCLGRLPFSLVVPVAVLTGLFGPALSGGWTARLPHVVTDARRLPRANALDAATFAAASLTGPALAGGAAQLRGAPAAVVAAALLVGCAVPLAWRMPGGTPTAGRRDTRKASSLLDDLTAGLRTVVRNRRLAEATLTSVLCCAAQGMLTACLPVLGERLLGGAGRAVLLTSCTAGAALAANAVLARFPRALAPDTIVRAGALLQSGAAALAALGRPVALVAALVVAGIGEGPQLTALFAIRHREAPERLRGQVFTTGASLKITGFAAGAALAGPLAPRSLPLAVGVSAFAALVGVARPGPRRPPGQVR